MKFLIVTVLILNHLSQHLSNADNVINRVLRQVLSYEQETADAQANNPWNPFTWFQPRLHSIPYNPDTDLTTVSCQVWLLLLLI